MAKAAKLKGGNRDQDNCYLDCLILLLISMAGRLLMPLVFIVAVITRIIPADKSAVVTQKRIDGAIFLAGVSVTFFVMEGLMTHTAFLRMTGIRSRLTEYSIAAALCMILSLFLALIGRGHGRKPLLVGYALIPIVDIIGASILAIVVEGFKKSSF